MEVYIVLDDTYDRNIICVTTSKAVANEAFDTHNEELLSRGFKPNSETERMCLIEVHPVIEEEKVKAASTACEAMFMGDD